MKITFILPAIGKKPGQTYLKSWLMEPLTIAVLNSIIPSDYEREFFDDRIENINYDIDVDLVSITVETYTAARAYFIADKFRAKGKTVVPSKRFTSTGLCAKSISVNLGLFCSILLGVRISFGTEIMNLAAESEISLLTKYVKCKI